MAIGFDYGFDYGIGRAWLSNILVLRDILITPRLDLCSLVKLFLHGFFNPILYYRCHLSHVYLQFHWGHLQSIVALSVLRLVLPYHSLSTVDHKSTVESIEVSQCLYITRVAFDPWGFGGERSFILMLLIFGLIEVCWNTYPSTVFSSGLLHACHGILLTSLVFAPLPTASFERVSSKVSIQPIPNKTTAPSKRRGGKAKLA
ncbi:hypothetical protein X801_04591 [Opisthorchis viverrini]|uniref:Uncharacterized protein n=1 Tax=Opisthorchis viverrini TaxID=6198 RepID=A0A1S8WYD1_OPIVI|nr:hypothetical protein X801_04591 [Opisthorchis viverrini]